MYGYGGLKGLSREKSMRYGVALLVGVGICVKKRVTA